MPVLDLGDAGADLTAGRGGGEHGDPAVVGAGATVVSGTAENVFRPGPIVSQ